MDSNGMFFDVEQKAYRRLNIAIGYDKAS